MEVVQVCRIAVLCRVRHVERTWRSRLVHYTEGIRRRVEPHYVAVRSGLGEHSSSWVVQEVLSLTNVIDRVLSPKVGAMILEVP